MRKMKIEVKQGKGLTLNAMKITMKLGTIVMSMKTVMKIRNTKILSKMGTCRQ